MSKIMCGNCGTINPESSTSCYSCSRLLNWKAPVVVGSAKHLNAHATYFTHNGSKIKQRVSVEPEHKYVASNPSGYFGFKTRKEALEFCKQENIYLKRYYHYRTYKIKREGN